MSKQSKRGGRNLPERSSVTRWTVVALVIVLLAGVAIRAVYLRELTGTPDFAMPLVDAHFHDYWARGLAFGQWSPPINEPDPLIRDVPFFRPPGYPYFLALVYKLTGGGYVTPRVIQMLIGVLNAFLAYALCRRLFGGVSALICAAFMSTYWTFVYFEGEFLEPVLSVLLMLVLVWVLTSWARRPSVWMSAGAGLLLGVTALVRPNALLLIAPILLWVIWIHRRRTVRRVGLMLTWLVLGTLLAVAPATIRNAVVADDLVLISSNGGINLYIGNNDLSDGLVRGTMPGIGTLDTSFDHIKIVRGVEARLDRPLRHSQVSNYLAKEALKWIRANPLRALKLGGRKTLLFWGPAETADNRVVDMDRAHSNVLRRLPLSFPVAFSLGLIGAVLVLANATTAGSRVGASAPESEVREAAALLVLLGVTWYASHVPFAVTSRYRVPIIPLLFMFGSYFVYRVFGLMRRRELRTAMLWISALAAVMVPAHVNFAGYKPNPARWHYARGAAYMRSGKMDAAIEEYQTALEHRADHLAVHNDLAAALASQGRLEESIPHFLYVVSSTPYDSEARFNLGLAFEVMGDYERSQEHYAEAVRLRPQDAEARAALARVSEALAATGAGTDSGR